MAILKWCLTHLMVSTCLNIKLVISQKISIRILGYYWPTLLLQANNIFLQSRVKRVIGWELPRISSLNSPCFTGCMNTVACSERKEKVSQDRLQFIKCLRGPIFVLIR